MDLAQTIERHAATNPGGVALIDADLGTQHSWARLNGEIDRLATAFAGHGVRAGERVALLLDNCAELVVAYFATARLGAVLVPISWRLTVPEIEYIANDAAPAVLMYDPPHAAAAARVRFERAPATFGTGGAAADVAVEDLGSQPVVPMRPRPAALADPHTILYTSGTTGLPKGARITQGNQYWSAFTARHYERHHHGDVALVMYPMYHTASLIFQSLPHLHAGATLVLRRAVDLDQVPADIATYGITSTWMLPMHVDELVDRGPAARSALSRLRRLTIAGGGVGPDALRYLVGLETRLGHTMGLTECGPTVNYVTDDAMRTKNGSLGHPAVHSAVRIVDDDLREVRPGETGEMIVAGPQVFDGYHRSGAEARDLFTPDGFFHTGDLVHADEDGFLWLDDRKKDMIKTGGTNVYSAEVERALRQHPAVLDVAVIGVPDPRWGEAVKAFVVLRAGAAAVTAADVESFCTTMIAGFKRPRIVEFVDALPRNATGKLLKHVLRNG